MRIDDGKQVISLTIPDIKGMTTIYKIGPYQCVVIKNDEMAGWSVGAILRRGYYMVPHRKASADQALSFIYEFVDVHKSIGNLEVRIIPPPPRDKAKKKTSPNL